MTMITEGALVTLVIISTCAGFAAGILAYMLIDEHAEAVAKARA